MLYFSNSLRLIFIHVMQSIPSIAEDKNKEIRLQSLFSLTILYMYIMEKTEIKSRVSSMQNLKDFVNLLNDIKFSVYENSKYMITEGDLLHFCNNKIVPNRYRTFYIRKKSGGLRSINAPCRKLSSILNVLNILFKSIYTPSISAMGFTEGRSVVLNASIHTGHHYVFNIDLENFFPSIPQARVWARIQLPPFNFPVEVANVVAGLCCHLNEDGTQSVLPQGAATSPLLTNAICDKLDRRMLGVAKKFGLHYSRYADDMTFSSMHNVYQEDSDFRKEIKRVIEEQGFKMNDKKTRLLRDGHRQEVTGLTVNENVNLTKKYVKDIRCLLHIWEKDGYDKAYTYFYPIYKKEKGLIKKGEPVMENVIGGKLNYMRMVKGAENAAYKKLLDRFNKLQDVAFVDNETEQNESYTYVVSYSIKDFENLFKTTISLEVSDKSNLKGICAIDGKNKSISISKSTQIVLCPNLREHNPGDIIESALLDNCFVSLCIARGKNFWLITKYEMKRSRCLNILNAHVDVDELLDIWEKSGIESAAKAFKDSILNGTSNAWEEVIFDDDEDSGGKHLRGNNKGLGDLLSVSEDPYPDVNNIDNLADVLLDPEDSYPDLFGLDDIVIDSKRNIQFNTSSIKNGQKKSE